MAAIFRFVQDSRWLTASYIMNADACWKAILLTAEIQWTTLVGEANEAPGVSSVLIVADVSPGQA
jgi:hypothetical protein